MFSLGKMPTTAISTPWLLFARKSVASIIVSAICIYLLELLERLLLPIQNITLLAPSGMLPCIVRQLTFSILSPPMPALLQPGSDSWERGRMAGRSNRSTWESPMMQLFGPLSIPAKHCSSYFLPHGRFGLDWFEWPNSRATGLMVLLLW